MILVRDVFQIDPEQMKQAKEWAREMRDRFSTEGRGKRRVLTDFVGDYYTLVLETEFESLGALEATLKQAFADPEWQESYARFRRVIVGGRRKIFSILD